MGYYIGKDGSYHEGDALPGDTPVPPRPDPTYKWDGTKWVQDPALAASKANVPTKEQLDNGDRAAIRSMRSIVNTLARLSPAFQPPSNTDQAYLVNSEFNAQNLRATWQPPKTWALADAKAVKIEQLRVQGLAYIQIGFIAQTFRWRTSQDQVIYLNNCAQLVSGNIMLGDSKVHIWDYSGVERALTPLNAGKLAGALNGWLYIAQREFWQQVAKVNAATDVAGVNAVTWTTQYTSSNPWNADTQPVINLPIANDSPLPDEILSQVFWG